jgi:hypothetical protein
MKICKIKPKRAAGIKENVLDPPSHHPPQPSGAFQERRRHVTAIADDPLVYMTSAKLLARID